MELIIVGSVGVGPVPVVEELAHWGAGTTGSVTKMVGGRGMAVPYSTALAGSQDEPPQYQAHDQLASGYKVLSYSFRSHLKITVMLIAAHTSGALAISLAIRCWALSQALAFSS
ncbi:hypothetical protein HAX54_033231 [Datura stramonium]|uniref:Uncharacterized protein n=1 Tax=Datura stramonium TaxID=4076 RepID=A0ABS8SDG2_DATST|nr:hypothetical protein [Datura stramonium]